MEIVYSEADSNPTSRGSLSNRGYHVAFLLRDLHTHRFVEPADFRIWVFNIKKERRSVDYCASVGCTVPSL